MGRKDEENGKLKSKIEKYEATLKYLPVSPSAKNEPVPVIKIP
jgi:hypothetical protein